MKGFKLSPNQHVKIKLWKDSLPPSPHHKIEKRFFNRIEKTTIGDAIFIIDNLTKKEFDATEYETW